MSDLTPPTIDQSVIERVASAQTLKPMICEMLSHRGERPNRVLRGGQELWETWVPSVQAGLRYFLSPSPIAGKEVVRDLATHVASAVMTWGGPHFKHIVSFNVLCEAIEASLASFATPPAECVATPGEVGKLCERLADEARWYPDTGVSALLIQAATLLTQMEAREQAMREAVQFLLWQKDRGGPVLESTEAWDTLRALLAGAGS